MKKTICILSLLTLFTVCLSGCRSNSRLPAETTATTTEAPPAIQDSTTEETTSPETAPVIESIPDLILCKEVRSVTPLSVGDLTGFVAYEIVFSSQGLDIQADIVTPASYTTSQYPVVFYLPEVTIDTSTLISWFAQNRVTVIRIYPRGQGKSQGVQDVGGTDHTDVITLAQILKEAPFFAENKTILTASSVGSILALRAASQSELFDGCAVVNTISDLDSFLTFRGEPIIQLFKNRIGYTIDEAPEEYQKRSALFFADLLELPVLIISYRQHPQFPESQASALHEKLQQAGQESELFYVHEISSDFVHETARRKLFSWIRTVE